VTVLQRRRRHRRMLGQSMVELGLVAPALVTLAAGGGQLGVIAYGSASVETAARAAARVATEYPSKSLDFVGSLGQNTYTCGQVAADTQTEDSVCSAARSSAGLLSGSSLTVTVTVSSSISRVPDDVVRTGNTCPGGALETGTVSNLPAGTVAAISSPSQATAGTVVSDSAGNYSICLTTPNSSQGNQNTSITATAVDGSGCVYSTSASLVIGTDKTVTPSPADMTLPATGVCPTPQPTPATTTSTPPPYTQGPVPTPAPQAACTSTVSDSSYVQVTVSFRAPVFVPFVGRYLESPAGSGGRTVSATQRMQIEPCTVTQGG
jgi:Flp pilus assembly protein TadG